MRESLGPEDVGREQAVLDQRLQKELSRRLHADPSLEMLRFEVSVEDGTVTLTGHMPSAELRQRAAALAAGVPGVREVINRIVVTEESA